MSETVLNYVINILENDPDFYVPLKKLWHGLQAQGLTTDLNHDYDAFLALLQGDERFEIEPSVEQALGEPPPWGPEEEPEMEALGFYLGSRVKLAARQMTVADLADILDRKTGDMMEALEKAWEMRPQDDQETEDLLIQVLAKAQRLRRETLNALEEAVEREEADPHQPD
jgi:DNA polymerase III delta prime subunit